MNLDDFTAVATGKDSSNRAASGAAELIPAKRILVVDDDPNVCWLISDFLAEENFEVVTVSDGEQAWETLHHGHYDLLLTDNEMPCLTGMKLIERIRSAGMSLPVILVSATFFEESARNHARRHTAAVVSKPFSKLELLWVVRAALSCGTRNATHACVGSFKSIH